MPTIEIIPAFRILLIAIVGILLGFIYPLSNDATLYASLILLLSSTWLIYINDRIKGRDFKLICSFLILASLFIFWAYSSNEHHLISDDFTDFSKLQEGEWIVDGVKQKEHHSEYTLYKTSGYRKGARIISYQKGAAQYALGQHLSLETKILVLDEPKNPQQFNYKAYLKRQGIIAKTYLDTQLVELHNLAPPIWVYPQIYRNQLAKTMDGYIDDKAARAVLKSLILGERGELDSETRSIFIESGTMHLLAISGMHLGIVAGILFLIIRRIWPYFHQRGIRSLVLIIGIWLYTAITGFPSSAVRASLMISLFVMGEVILRSHSKYNTLFATALIMLIIHPSYLFDVGFQLSFLAVLSIFYFYPIFNQILSFENEIFRKVWSLISLSLAAQIGTLGLAIHYFHVFSPWFWIIGIPATIITSVTLILGLVFLLISFSSVTLTTIIGSWVEWLTHALINSIEAFDSFYFHHFDDIFWTPSSLLFWYLGVLVISIYIHYRKHIQLLYLSLSLFASCVCLNSWHSIDMLQNKEVVKVIDGKKEIFELHIGRNAYVIHHEHIDTCRLNYLIGNYRISNRIDKVFYLKQEDQLTVDGTMVYSKGHLGNGTYNYCYGNQIEKKN